MEERFERFSMAIFHITRYWNKIASDVMHQYDLKGPYALYILAMSESEEGITSIELCEKYGRDKADVSRAINAMEKKGLVVRRGETVYRARVALTENGKALADELGGIVSKATAAAGVGIGDDKRAEFYNNLEIIKENLREVAYSGLSEKE